MSSSININSDNVTMTNSAIGDNAKIVVTTNVSDGGSYGGGATQG